jgi:hypothetical protein
MITQQAHEQQLRASAFEVERERGLQAIYAHYRNLKPCEANQKWIYEICDQWAGEPIAPNVTVFDLALQANPNLVDSFAIEHINEQRKDLVQQILGLLRSKNEGRDGLYSTADLRSKKIKMASWSREKLEARISELLSKQAQNKMSVPQLRQVVRDATKDTRRYPGYPNLPEMIVPPGQVEALRCDSAYLLNLARTDFYEYKRMCARYSTAQISDRQQGKSYLTEPAFKRAVDELVKRGLI